MPIKRLDILNKRNITYILLLQLMFCAFFCQKGMADDLTFQYPFYIGIEGGYGSTTWDGIVPSKKNLIPAIVISTPIKANEGGGVWGFFGGYEVSPYFAIEASYMRYQDAQVMFSPTESLFSFEHNGVSEFTTHTEAFNLMGKIMLIIPHTHIRAYSSAGVAEVHRVDMLFDHWRTSPTFGLGLYYNFTPHVMGELGGNYTAGYGEAQLNPTNVYVPFLYSVVLRLAYRF